MRLRNADFFVWYKCLIQEIILYLSTNIVDDSCFFYFLHIAFYHCPRSHYGYKGEREGRKPNRKPQQEASQQFKVTNPISMADLENIHTRRGKYPSHPPLDRTKNLGIDPKVKGGKSA